MKPLRKDNAPTGLRVIGGRYRRRRLETLPGEETRPMLDRMRETLFNVLQGEIEGKVFADLYAGTGAVGIEALSRGARLVLFVESGKRAVDLIRANLRVVGAQDDARIVFSPVAKALETLRADIVFLGPPYHAHQEYEATLAALGANPPSLAIAQHDRAYELSGQYGGLEKYRTIAMGRNVLSFFSKRDAGEDEPASEAGAVPEPANADPL